MSLESQSSNSSPSLRLAGDAPGLARDDLSDEETARHRRIASEVPTLLVVEDDPDIREVLAELLETHGYKALTAANGHEALEVLREGDPVSAILLDLMMPRMDGWQFRIEQQADDELSSIPVIVMTASMYADGMPADTVLLSKPVSVDEVLDQLRRVCAG